LSDKNTHTSYKNAQSKQTSNKAQSTKKTTLGASLHWKLMIFAMNLKNHWT